MSEYTRIFQVEAVDALDAINTPEESDVLPPWGAKYDPGNMRLVYASAFPQYSGWRRFVVKFWPWLSPSHWRVEHTFEVNQ